MKYYVVMRWRERLHRIASLDETVADYEMSTQWEQKKRAKRQTPQRPYSAVRHS